MNDSRLHLAPVADAQHVRKRIFHPIEQRRRAIVPYAVAKIVFQRREDFGVLGFGDIVILLAQFQPAAAGVGIDQQNADVARRAIGQGGFENGVHARASGDGDCPVRH